VTAVSEFVCVTGDTTAAQFLASVTPLLEADDTSAATLELGRSWPPERVAPLLVSPNPAVVKTAVACLATVGTMRHGELLAALLHHPDPAIVCAAENGLWAIWMRAGTPTGNHRLAAAIERIKREDLFAALRILHALTLDEPTFSEPHHQRGLTLTLLDRHTEAERAYRRAHCLNALHFAAVAGLGNVYVQRGEFVQALRYYRRALEIHPRFEGAAEIVCSLEQILRQRRAAQ